MRHDACSATPTDPRTVATSNATSSYYDPFVYAERAALPARGNPRLAFTMATRSRTANARRKFNGLSYDAGSDNTATTSITVVGDADPAAFERFEAPTRMALARAAMYQVVKGESRRRSIRPLQDASGAPNHRRPDSADGQRPCATGANRRTASDGRWNLPARPRRLRATGRTRRLGCGAAGRTRRCPGPPIKTRRFSTSC